MKKIKKSITKYWYLFAIALVAILSIVFLRKTPLEKLYQSLLKRYHNLINEQDKDLQEIQRIHEEEKERQAELDRQYSNAVGVLEDKHKINVENLTAEQKEKINSLLSETNSSPEEMADKINQTLGLPIRRSDSNV